LKSTQIVRQLSRVALVALAIGLFAGYGKAQDAYQGKFTLPFQAEWGGAVLTPGDYTITIKSAASPYLIYLQGERKSAFILTVGVDSSEMSDRSQLTVVIAGGHRVVTALQAGQLGLVLDYPSIRVKRERARDKEVSEVRLTVSPVGS
jgi:hypothetical protein